MHQEKALPIEVLKESANLMKFLIIFLAEYLNFYKNCNKKKGGLLMLKKKKLIIKNIFYSTFLNDLLSKESPLSTGLDSLSETALSTTSINPSLNLSKSSLYRNILCFSK